MEMILSLVVERRFRPVVDVVVDRGAHRSDCGFSIVSSDDARSGDDHIRACSSGDLKPR